MNNFRNRYRDEILAYSFLWPSLLILFALLLYPLFYVIRLSFYDSNLTRETWVGLSNYATLINDPLFWTSFLQTVLFTAGSVIMHLVIGLALALLLNAEINRRLRSLARGILIVPWLLAPTVAGMIWVLMLAPLGVVNALLANLGIVDQNANIAWLGDPSTSLLSVTAMNVWRAFPFFMVMLLAGLQAIPLQLYEAAEIDGATLFEQFRYVTLPQLRSVIATIGLLDSIWTFRAFDPVFIMTGGGPTNSSEVLATAIYFDGFQKLKFGYASAEAVVMFIVLFIVSGVYVRRAMSTLN
jgi:multiple sugar transport system permease protein